MTTKRTDEQRKAVEACAGQPVLIADEATHKVYYLLKKRPLPIWAACNQNTTKLVAPSCAK